MKKLLFCLLALAFAIPAGAQTKFSDFTASTAPASGDFLVGYLAAGGAGSNRRYTIANILGKAPSAVSPATDDGAPLGDVTHGWSDLFLASGALINYANGNVVLTHSSGVLTMGTGEFRITTPGTNSASVVTIGGTQTLTNKTFVAPALGAATATTINGLTITSGSTNTLTIPNGASLITSGAFGLTLTATGTTNVTFPTTGTLATLAGTETLTNKTLTGAALNGTIGATTPSTGVFTTGVFGSTTSLLLGTAGSAVGNIGFRNATSGTITLAPTTGALGTVTITLPATTGTVAMEARVDSTQTGVHATPTTTNPLSPTWSGLMHSVWYGATGTINLPAAAGYTGRSIIIYNTGAFTVTVDPNGSEVVVRDGTVQTGGVSFTLSTGAGNYVALISDGARWITLGFKGTLTVGT